MLELCVGGLAVWLGQIVKTQVGVTYSLATPEDIEVSLRLITRLSETEKLVDSCVIEGDVVILTSFTKIEEAERFLVAEFGEALVEAA